MNSEFNCVWETTTTSHRTSITQVTSAGMTCDPIGSNFASDNSLRKCCDACINFGEGHTHYYKFCVEEYFKTLRMRKMWIEFCFIQMESKHYTLAQTTN